MCRIYTSSFYGNQGVRDQYRGVFGSYPLVTLSDVFFGIHALVLTILTMSQVFLYKEPGNKIAISRWNSYLMTGLLVGGAVLSVDSIVGHAWALDVLYYLSGVKMVITSIKYLPQVSLLDSERAETECGRCT